jgi:lipoteichoic acid synthase
VLSLLVPFVIYNLALKAISVIARHGNFGVDTPLDLLNLMCSDVFFNLGYALLWIGLFAVVRGRRGPLRWVVVGLFHITTMFVVVVSTFAHQYFRQTGTTFDYDIVALWLPRIDEITPILFQGGVPLWAWILLLAALFYAALGPWLVMRTAGRQWRWPQKLPPGTPSSSLLAPLVLWLLALVFVSLSPLVGSSRADVTQSFARDPFVNLVLTGVEEETAKGNSPDTGAVGLVDMAANASLAQTPRPRSETSF